MPIPDPAIYQLKAVEDTAYLVRGPLHPEDLGLTLAEAKNLLESVQRTLVKRQVVRYLEQQAYFPGCGKKLERIKWFLWHGNVFRILQTESWLSMDIDSADPTEKQQKLLKKLDEFETYIRNNVGLIPNYGERWR